MTLLPLLDNSLFLRNWRERMRPTLILSSTIITSIVIVFFFLAAYIQHDLYKSISPPLIIFWYMILGHGVLLLLIGTSMVGHMSVQERISGTLDFHRASPTSRWNQILGILVGAPVLEWCIFSVTLPISLVLASISEIGLINAIVFYISLILCAIFFHFFSLFGALHSDRKIVATQNRTGILKIFLFLYFFPLFFVSFHFSSLYHLTCLPQYIHVTGLIFKTLGSSLDKFYTSPALPFRLYSVQLPSLLFQGIVEIPFIIFFSLGVMRKISRPERPIFSKKQSLVLIGLILFLFVGSAIPLFEYAEKKISPDAHFLTVCFVYLTTFLGILGATSITPSQLLYLKGLRKLKKLGQKKILWQDDHATNSPWLFGFALIALLFHFLFTAWMTPNLLDRFLVFSLTILYVFSLAWALEYFRLSQHHTKRSLFIVLTSIVWFFIPLLGLIMQPLFKQYPDVIYYFFAPSPLFGLGSTISIILSKSYYQNIFEPMVLVVTVLINLIIALICLLFTKRERKFLRQKVF